MFDVAARLSGKEREEFYVSLSRGFKPGESFIQRFRFKPCAAMLAVINYRMEKFDPHVFNDYMRKYYVAQDQFIKAGIYVPGFRAKNRAFWLFPIVTPHKLLFVQFLLESGINAYKGATQLAYVKPSPGYKDAENSKWLMENVIYLPIHWGMTDEEIRETVERVIDCYGRLSDYLKSIGKVPSKERTAKLLERPRL